MPSLIRLGVCLIFRSDHDHPLTRQGLGDLHKQPLENSSKGFVRTVPIGRVLYSMRNPVLGSVPPLNILDQEDCAQKV